MVDADMMGKRACSYSMFNHITYILCSPPHGHTKNIANSTQTASVVWIEPRCLELRQRLLQLLHCATKKISKSTNLYYHITPILNKDRTFDTALLHGQMAVLEF